MRRILKTLSWLLGLMTVCGAVSVIQTLPKARAVEEPTPVTAGAKKSDDEDRVSLDVARERAATLHLAYSATLDTIHHYYFRKDQSVLPARAMEEIFKSVNRQSKVKANWISVNTKPMSVDHEPSTDFEKKAAAEIASGKEMFEAVEGGYLRSASSIPLHGGCVSCHVGSAFGPPPKGPRYAGLVISVPIKE